MGKGPNSAWEAPNAILVGKKTNVSSIVSAIRSLVAQRYQPAAPSPSGLGSEPDAIDQVKRLGELRDSGLLSDEEFQQKKRQLLGL